MYLNEYLLSLPILRIQREKGEGHIGTQKFAFRLPEQSSFYGTHWLQFEVI